MTSRAEACPNIAMEALAAGCLCVSTDQPPMPEFFQKASRYYARGCGGQLAERIAELLAVPEDAAQKLRAAARARAAEFTWQRTVEQTVEQLRLALYGPPFFRG